MALVAGPSQPAWATFQLNYQFTPATGVANTSNMSSGATSIGFNDEDDGSQTVAALDIGFPFVLDGTSYTKFSVNTNGLLKLGNDGIPVSPAGFNDPFPDPSTNLQDTDYPFISATWDDLVGAPHDVASSTL
jgi:hypothetical protein